jgi:hypothetical protein
MRYQVGKIHIFDSEKWAFQAGFIVSHKPGKCDVLSEFSVESVSETVASFGD